MRTIIFLLLTLATSINWIQHDSCSSNFACAILEKRECYYAVCVSGICRSKRMRWCDSETGTAVAEGGTAAAVGSTVVYNRERSGDNDDSADRDSRQQRLKRLISDSSIAGINSKPSDYGFEHRHRLDDELHEDEWRNHESISDSPSHTYSHSYNLPFETASQYIKDNPSITDTRYRAPIDMYGGELFMGLNVGEKQQVIGSGTQRADAVRAEALALEEAFNSSGWFPSLLTIAVLLMCAGFVFKCFKRKNYRYVNIKESDFGYSKIDETKNLIQQGTYQNGYDGISKNV